MSEAAEQIVLSEAESTELVQGLVYEEYTSLVRELVPLTPGDLEVLNAAGPEHSQDQLKHIRTYHHIIAMRLGRGDRPFQICAAMSLTPQTITKLLGTPQFVELVEHYRGLHVQESVSHFELMGVVSAEALSAIHERLIGDERNEIPLEQLRRLGETFVDRIGHSPVRRSESSNVHRHVLDTSHIERIKALHSEQRRWNDPAGAVSVATTPHEEDSLRQGAASGAAAIFLSPPQRQTEPDSGEGSGV